MGADANTKPIICTRSAQIATDMEKTIKTHHIANYSQEDSTIDHSMAEKIVEKCSTLKSHEDELKVLKEIGIKTPILPSEIGTDTDYKFTMVWFNALGFVVLHILASIGVWISVTGNCDYKTTLYGLWLIYASGQGVTMGAHRLFCHKAFKAKLWLRVTLLWLHTLAGQNCLWVWVRDHRQHHKFSDTDADPHNANRGFFFSHMGWLTVRKHPKVVEYGRKIDMSDLEADPWIMFQKRYYKPLYTIFALLLPTSVPIIFWGEEPVRALFVAYFARTIINLNATWLVNSAAHMFGTRPYDKSMSPVESAFVSFLAVGEGWHNYHHAFPWDYRASEYGTPLNLTGWFIDLFAKFGVVYDRREATSNMVKNRAMRTGDDSHAVYGTDEGRHESNFKTAYGWWKHPMNPSYTSVKAPKPKFLQSKGYALESEELDVAEKDEAMLEKSNQELMKIQNATVAPQETGGDDGINKYIVDRAEADKVFGKLSKYITEHNHNEIKKKEKPKKIIVVNNEPSTSSSSSSNSDSESSIDENINNNSSMNKSDKTQLNVMDDLPLGKISLNHDLESLRHRNVGKSSS